MELWMMFLLGMETGVIAILVAQVILDYLNKKEQPQAYRRGWPEVTHALRKNPERWRIGGDYNEPGTQKGYDYEG